MKTILISAVIVPIILLATGCIGSGNSPVIPAGNQKLISGEIQTGYRDVWGYYEVHIEPATNTCQVIPLRTASMTANLNNLLESKPGNLLIHDMDITKFSSEGRIDCTVTLKHPFPGLYQYNGFDVWGVFIHYGVSPVGYDGLTFSGGPAAGPDEAVLLNPDGYTRWYNKPEFSGTGSPLVTYFPGKLGNLLDPTAKLNPYKIFADGLGVNANYYDWINVAANWQDRGIFRAGSSNSRRYQLKFPLISGQPVVKFQYAVIGSWEPGDPAKTGNPAVYDPADFPTSANCEEAFFLSVSSHESSVYYENSTKFGGTFKAKIEVFDWQGGSVGQKGVVNEIHKIIVNGNFLPGGTQQWSQTELSAVASGGSINSSVFQVEVSNCTPSASGVADFWIIVEAAGLNGASYNQGFPSPFPAGARRAAFMRSTVNILNKAPWPDVIYVDNANTSGIEDGSPDHPWNTIQEGIDNNPLKKEVWVDDSGIKYEEKITMVSNTILKSVNWDTSDGTNRAVIHALQTTPSNTFILNGVSNVTIQGFKILPAGQHGSSGIDMYRSVWIWITNTPTACSDITIKDCWFTGTLGAAPVNQIRILAIIHATGAVNLTVQNCLASDIDTDGTPLALSSSLNFVNATNCINLKILGNEVTRWRWSTDNNNKFVYPFSIITCTSPVVNNNLIHNIKPGMTTSANWVYPINFQGCVNLTAVNNTIDNIDATATSGPVGGQCDQIIINQSGTTPCSGVFTIENNIISNIKGMGMGGQGRGICAYYPAGGVFPYNCTFNITQGPAYYACSPGVGAISADPQFENNTVPPYNYRLKSGSPALNGNPAIFDYDGVTPSQMGCYGGPGGQYVGLLTPQ